MSDLSIMIKIGGQLEKSFDDTIRAAQSGLSNFNAAVSREMAEAGRMSAAASKEMAAAGKMGAGASKEMAAAGKMNASVYRSMATEGKRASVSSRDIASSGKDAASALKEMAAEGINAADAVKSIVSTGKVTPASINRIASAVKQMASAFRGMSSESRSATKDMQAGGEGITSLSTNLLAGGNEITSLAQNMGGAGEMAGAASKGFLVAGAAIAATAAVAATAGKVIKEVGEYSVQVGKEFESSMSDAAATANATAEDFVQMEQAAMEMGKTTSKTASESAEALKYMSLAGWDVDTSVSALPSVLKMSEASGMDLGRTSDLVTDSMAALGVTVDQLPGYLDVATKAQNKSNQTAEQLMDAYLGVGGTMKNLNVPITESATALGVLANRGIKGSEAGNALNAVMVNLTTGTGQAGKMMQELGVSAFDQQGRFIGLEESLRELNAALQGYSEEERNAAIAAIGGKQHMDALNDLMAGLNTTNKEGISEWAALTKELENCNGSLQAMRDMKLDNLEGDLKTLESATQDAGIKIYKHLNTPMREFTQFKIQAVYQASDALESDGFAGMAMAAGDALADGMGMVVERAPEFLAKAAVSVGSFLVGFATELPASLLSGILKGAPRLLKALPGIGVDIVKAIIKGIFSVGSAPVKAIGSLFFGDGDAAEIEKADMDVPKSYDPKIVEDMTPAIDTPQILPSTQANDTDLARASLAGLASSEDGQDVDIPNIMADTGSVTETGAADIGPMRMDTDAIKADIPPVFDMGSALQMAKDLKVDIPGETGAQTQTDGNVFANISVEAPPIPAKGTVTQTPARAERMPVEFPTVDMDTTGMIESPIMPPVNVVQDTVLTPPDVPPDMPAQIEQVSSGTTPEISMESPQISPVDMPDVSLEDVQISPDIMPDMAIETAQVSAERIPDAAMEGVQIPTGAIQTPDVLPDTPAQIEQISSGTTPEISMESPQISLVDMPDVLLGDVQIPTGAIQMPVAPPAMEQTGNTLETTGVADITQDVAAMAITRPAGSQAVQGEPRKDITAQDLENTPLQNIQMPAAGIGMAELGNRIAQFGETVRKSITDSWGKKAITQLRDAVHMGAADNLPTIQISGRNADDTAPFGQPVPADGLDSRTIIKGIGKNISGLIHTFQAGIDMAGTKGGQIIQISPLIPLQRENLAVSEGALPADLGTVAPQDRSPHMDNPLEIPPNTKPHPAVITLYEPNEEAKGISNWAREITDMRQIVLEIPGLEPEPEHSVIDEVLEILLGKRKDLYTPASPASSPQFIYNPIINIKGSGDVKEDVEKANQMGMREFDRLMQQWVKQNKRRAFT